MTTFKMTTLTCLIVAMCFLHSRGEIMTSTLPTILPLDAMQRINNNMMMDVISPFGCLQLTPSQESAEPSIECVKEVTKPIIDRAIEKDSFRIPSFKVLLEQFTQCKLEKLNLIENGKLSIDNYVAFRKSYTYVKSNSKDLELLNEVNDKCVEEVEVDDKSAIEGAVALDKCIYRLILDRCTNDRGVDSVEGFLPIMYALYSFFDDNEECDSVKAEVQRLMDYTNCVEDEWSGPFKVTTPIFNNRIENILKFVSIFNKVPEIECLEIISEDYGLHKDGRADFSAIASYIGELWPWKSEELKKKVSETLEECGNVKASVEYKRAQEFRSCFFPAFADICGLDNQLSSLVLFPMLNENLWSSVLNRINENYDLIALLKMLYD